MTLSIIVPCFNEAATIATIVERVVDAPVSLHKQLVVVDDGSTDGSAEIVRRLPAKYAGRDDVDVIAEFHDANRGKGRAVRTGLARATGEIVVIQDADLEYDPRDYPSLVAPIVDGASFVVYGSRRWQRQFAAAHPGHWRFALGNWLITRATNVLFGANLSDQSTGYKVFHRSVAERLALTSDGFEVCAEITARVRKLGYRIRETPVAYRPRTVREGKKIRASDGWRILATLVRQRLTD